MEVSTDALVNELTAKIKGTKSKRARRVLEARLPKLVESHKQAMLIRGGKSSEIINEVLKDLHFLKSPHAVRLNRHNHILPFEVAGRESLEFLAKKNDCSLMAFGYHQKKRPHSLIFARFFAYQLLQMIEVGITGYTPPNAPGSKPCFVFVGDLWESDEVLSVFKNLLLDFFRVAQVDKINISGLDHVIQVTAVSGEKILFRHYAVQMTRAAAAPTAQPAGQDASKPDERVDLPPPAPVGSSGMRVQLREMGPSLDFVVRRHLWGDPALLKAAHARPKGKAVSETKNLSKGLLGESLGRLHPAAQDFGELRTHVKLPKSLRNAPKKAGADADAEDAAAMERDETPAGDAKAQSSEVDVDAVESPSEGESGDGGEGEGFEEDEDSTERGGYPDEDAASEEREESSGQDSDEGEEAEGGTVVFGTPAAGDDGEDETEAEGDSAQESSDNDNDAS